MEEYEVISIPVSDGTERDFAIMDTFEFEGQGYLAVSLIEGDEIQEGVYIYRYHNAEDGDVVVEQITLPAEYKKVTKFYEQMINSCANGIAVVNIDNGYGAGYLATQINWLAEGK